MKVLVTGGAGFIGSHVADRLLARGDRVVVLDDFNDFYDPASKRSNVADHVGTPEYRLVEGDIGDRALVMRLFAEERFDAVVHLAARAGVRPSLADPALYEEVNCLGTIRLLQAAAAHGRPRFVFGSSSSVYGIGARIPFSETDPADRPISPYAATKRAGELHVFTAHHLSGLDALCLRFFTVYGPRQRPEMAIARFIAAIERGDAIPVFGDGSSRRDYTYIDDVVDGVEAALAGPGGFDIVNLGGSRPVTLSDLIAEIEKATGRPARIERKPDQPGDVPVTFADVRKARERLGFEARVPLAEGIRRTVAWHRSHARAGAITP